MALNEKDLSQIKDIVQGESENLAQIVARGFAETATKEDFKYLDKRIDGLDKSIDGLGKRMDKFEIRMERFETRLAHIDAQISVIERDVAEIRKELISRMEIEDIWARLSLIETKLGITSGK